VRLVKRQVSIASHADYQIVTTRLGAHLIN
jgi:hypothetical protein